MKFKKPFDRQETFTKVGSPLHQEFESSFDEKGRIVLTPVNPQNKYLEIQSFADSVDINILIAKYEAGDETALNRVQGYYGDFSNLPDNIHDIYNLIQRARQDFDGLDVGIRNQFDNSFEQYLFSVGTEDWFNKMKIDQPIKEEVKTDEHDAG